MAIVIVANGNPTLVYTEKALPGSQVPKADARTTHLKLWENHLQIG